MKSAPLLLGWEQRCRASQVGSQMHDKAIPSRLVSQIVFLFIAVCHDLDTNSWLRICLWERQISITISLYSP